MTLTPELKALALVTTATALMWIPYVLARAGSQGPLRAMGNNAAQEPPRWAWADRAKRAHANAIENLAVFAPLVLIASAAGATNATTATAAQVFLAARLVHYAVYVTGIPMVRTAAFLTGWACTMTVAASIFGLVG